MRIASVVEAQDSYYELEMAIAAQKLTEEVLEVQSGQTVVFTTDTQTDMRVVNACAKAVFVAGGIPVIINYHTQLSPQLNPPDPIAAAVSAADTWVEFAVSYTMYTDAWHKAIEAGVQYYCLYGMDVDGMVRCVGQQDVNKLAEMGDLLIDMLTDAEVRITSIEGTDLSFNNTGATIGSFAMKANPDKTPIMLSGQVSWTPNEASMQGKIIVDGVLYPPTEIGIVNQPVALDIESGRITGISGEREARVLQNWIDELNDSTLYRIAHASYGFNPGISNLTGRIVEDERAFGDFNFGWGAWVGRPAAGHWDITTRSVSVWINGEQVQDNGVMIQPELAAICRAMNVPRH